MQFLLLIYDNEMSWTSQGKPDYSSELAEYKAFGKEFAKSILGGNASSPPLLPGPSASETVHL